MSAKPITIIMKLMNKLHIWVQRCDYRDWQTSLQEQNWINLENKNTFLGKKVSEIFFFTINNKIATVAMKIKVIKYSVLTSISKEFTHRNTLRTTFRRNLRKIPITIKEANVMVHSRQHFFDWRKAAQKLS